MYVVDLADAPQKAAVAVPPTAAAVLTLGFVADDLHPFIHY